MSARRYLRIVLRDKPVRRSISRIGTCCRKCQRRITLNNAMSITPESSDQSARGKSKHGSLLSGNLCPRSEEHTSELQSLMRISYAVFCLKKKKTKNILTKLMLTLTK